jgi:alpha-galactosidase
MYLSGRIDLLRDEDFASLKAGVELYKELRSEFADALPIFSEGLNTFENDWMVGGRITTENNIYLTVAHMKGEETERQIEMPYLEKGEISAEILYPENLGSVSAKDGTLTVKLPEKSAILIKITA